MLVIRFALILVLVFLPASPFATTFPVTKTADTDDGVCDPDCSLREAIDAANTNPGADDVPVPAGTYLLTLGQLVVSDAVSIVGEGQTNTIIDGNATDRVFDIEATSGVVEISGVTIQNGNIDSVLASGGGIRAHSLTLTNSTVSGNNSSYYGGGISARSLILINSTVSGNSAHYDGGDIWANPYAYDGIGDLTLTNSTVSGNIANVGGGIFHKGYASAGVTSTPCSTARFLSRTCLELNATSTASSRSGCLGAYANIVIVTDTIIRPIRRIRSEFLQSRPTRRRCGHRNVHLAHQTRRPDGLVRLIPPCRVFDEDRALLQQLNAYAESKYSQHKERPRFG